MAPIWIGGLGALVGGLGAASAAVAAWRAALSSARAAIEAREAMALAVRPSVEVWAAQWGGPESPASARVWVQGAVCDWPATDVVLQFALASGKRGSTSIKLLEPLYEGSSDRPFMNIDIEQPSDTWPPPGGDRLEITVLFSDTRHAASYRITASADIRRYAEGGTALSVVITEPSKIERLPATHDPQQTKRRRRPAFADALNTARGRDPSTP